MAKDKTFQKTEPNRTTFQKVIGNRFNVQLPATQRKKITPTLKSPLRYPGGKTRAVKEIIKYFPPDVDRVCSPFLGGGSIELELVSRGVEVFGYDIFEPVVDFWQVLLKNPKKLAQRVRKYYPLTRSKFYDLQSTFSNVKTQEERAAIFFVLNRASFSGTTLSGGMSPDHPRFTPTAIAALERFEVEHFHVQKMDFKLSLEKHRYDFLYLDPPYLLENPNLYGTKGDTHKGFDHLGLAEILTKRGGWILSYNDCPEVRKMYKGFNILTPQWAYGMNTDKKSNELLILSKDFIEL
jgi:DNA adenine methylase